MIKCYIDVSGYHRVDANDVHPLIGSYLEQDVQRYPTACDEVLKSLEEVEKGIRDSWSGTGNAHTVTIDPDGVSIVNEWDDSFGMARLSHSVFRQSVEAWRQFIAS